MTTRKWLTPILALLLVFTAACSSSASKTSGSGPATPDTIVIKNFAFSPSNLTVAPGATVTVMNEDSTAHTVTATNQGFDTGNIGAGATKTFTAPSKAGSYGYICNIHQYMTGTLTVS